MKLLVDVQCIQSTSSLRGIGRYALCFTRALVEQAGPHSVELLLNGGDDAGRLMRARTALESFLPPHRIHVFDAPWPWTAPFDARRRPLAEAAYAAAVRSIGPDALLVASPFEGDEENVLALRRTAQDPPAAAVLYDLIPALDPGTYLLGPGAATYWRRLEEVKRCDALLAISRYSGQQAEQLLGESCPTVTPVWGGPYPSGDFPAFESHHDDDPQVQLPERYLLSVGGDHPRKNLDRLVIAWAQVPDGLRALHPLVIACRLNTGTVRRLRRISRKHGLPSEHLVLTGGVSETTLRRLYEGATAFVFPSTEEGLGMPPLEAMSLGCPTVLARGSSLTELCDDPEAFFDGEDVASMAAAMHRLLVEPAFRDRLRAQANVSAERFTWTQSARTAWRALEALPTFSPRPASEQAHPVRLSDASAVAGLAARPSPVVVDTDLAISETGVLRLPVGVRATLAGATALLVDSAATASSCIAAGLVDQPVLQSPWQLDLLHVHDFHEQYALGLRNAVPAGDLASEVVQAVAIAPRWTLERPRPVWLLLLESVPPGLDARLSAAGADLLVVPLQGAGLGSRADVVLLPAEDVAQVEPSLAAVRRRGARVVALQHGTPTQTPPWCEDAELDGPPSKLDSWEERLEERVSSWGRTTGWPWRDAH